MNSPTSASLERHIAHADARTPLNVVIAYDGIAAAQHALDILDNLSTRDPGASAKMCASTWWFRFLEDPDLLARATAAGSHADMLVIAANHEVSLPSGVESWLESSLAKKRGPEVAVVALLRKEDCVDRPDSPRFQFVRRIAREAGACFFAPFAKPAPCMRGAE